MGAAADVLRRSRPRGGGRGLTLLEMLVTLALVAAASALIAQALAQLAQLELRLQAGGLHEVQGALRREWVRRALEGLQTGARGDAFVPRGQADWVEGYSSQPPWPGSQGPEGMRLELRRQDGWTRLLARRAGPDAAPWADGATEWELARWPGAQGAFEFLDWQGQWRADWPPPLGPQADAPDAPPPLPRAVRLQGWPEGVLLAVPLAGRHPMPSRAEVER